MLLGRDDVNPNTPDHSGRTPLCWAAENGHEGVVIILLARDDINPDTADNWGQTALSCAVRNGHTRVITLLRPPTAAAHRTD